VLLKCIDTVKSVFVLGYREWWRGHTIANRRRSSRNQWWKSATPKK